jgi:anti-sigma28 factor (negative regulator of flagellin synthesis)
MQISTQEAMNARRREARPIERPNRPPAATVEGLAEAYGVRPEEARRFAGRALAAEDPARERRVRELGRRVRAGAYHVDAEQVVDMAERRALADQAGRL